MFDSVRETTFTGIPQPVIDFYDMVLCKIPGHITYQSIREMYVEVYKMSLSRTRLRTKFLEPLEDIGWLTHEPDPTDWRRVIFVKYRIEGESGETMDISDRSHFQEIFPEEQLEKHMGELEKIWNHNAKCVRGTTCEREGNGYSWFFSEKVPYFLEEHNWVNAKRKNGNSMKCESSINGHNLQEKKEECGSEQQRLLDQYDEGTVLLQIPQEDTRIEDAVKKFEDLNKVITTIIVLKEMGKVMVGQGFIRRLCRSNNLIT